MSKLRLAGVAALILFVAAPLFALGPTSPKMDPVFPETSGGKTTYAINVTNRDGLALSALTIYAPISAGLITASSEGATSWTSSITPMGGGTYSKITWLYGAGMPFNGVIKLIITAPDWTSTNFMYVPADLNASNWAYGMNGSTGPWEGPTSMPVPEGLVTPEPSSLASLGGLGLLVLGMVRRRK